MAKSIDDIKYGTAQAKIPGQEEDTPLRVAYKHGTPLEGGKIADSHPVDLFSSATNIARASARHDTSGSHDASHLQPQSQQRQDASKEDDEPKNATPTNVYNIN
ncbi:hypothetical protein ACFE04_023336 [Oxalis oulophora]